VSFMPSCALLCLVVSSLVCVWIRLIM
jgi:hypothetical protein